jgi:8-oxo-dGTP pyrophosphatase MutT (NUDIX family)
VKAMDNLKGEICVKAICLITNGEKVLAGKFRDDSKNQDFYRVLGGSLNFGETSEQGVKREIKEEIGCNIENLEFVDIVESIFTYNGKKGHQIMFLYRGDLSDENIYKKNIIHVVDPEGYEFDAEWVFIKDILENRAILYPQYDYSKVLHQK